MLEKRTFVCDQTFFMKSALTSGPGCLKAGLFVALRLGCVGRAKVTHIVPTLPWLMGLKACGKRPGTLALVAFVGCRGSQKRSRRG